MFAGNVRRFVPQEEVQFLLILEVVEQKGLADPRLVCNLLHGAFAVGIL